MEQEEQLDYIKDNRIDETEEVELFQKLVKVDGFEDYIKKVMAKDIQRYFSATQENQPIIRGGYMRAEYFLKKMLETKANLDK